MSEKEQPNLVRAVFVGGTHDGLHFSVPDGDEARRIKLTNPHDTTKESDYQRHRMMVGKELVTIYGVVGMTEDQCLLQIINRYGPQP